MRYQCPNCLKWVQDKPFFGTLHICADEEEVKKAWKNSESYRQQRKRASEKLPEWLRT